MDRTLLHQCIPNLIACENQLGNAHPTSSGLVLTLDCVYRCVVPKMDAWAQVACAQGEDAFSTRWTRQSEQAFQLVGGASSSE